MQGRKTSSARWIAPKLRWVIPVLWAVVADPGLAASTVELRGQIRLADDPAQSNPAEMRQTVVYFESRAATAKAEPPPEPFEVVTVRKDFEPHVAAVPVGSTVRFPNQDRILHNVFSVSAPNDFDLGLYRQGEAPTVILEHPGVVQVYCNVHHAMAASILVLETPFHTTPDADGAFVLTGLPAGPGQLTVWHERAEPITRQIELPTSQVIDLELTFTKKRVPRHTNKFGRPYTRRGRGEDYR